MPETKRKTRSVCPICLKNIPAALVERNGIIYMEKSCPDHGDFSVAVWRGMSDFDAWRGDIPALRRGEGEECPSECGHCKGHPQGSCCVLLEVTRRCNLNCRFCFADGSMEEPSLSELKKAVRYILSKGKPLIQLSGGEPTLRDDLPELIRYIKENGGKFVQLNSNGLRLAEDREYVKRLADAGLSFVFMQFDGVDDGVYATLRGTPLLDIKKRAIEVCGEYGLGVTLVPTVVRGVNDTQIGDIIRFGAQLTPTVRGVHFQPVSYFGRYPDTPGDDSRYTLDELINAIETQADIKEGNISPSRCDHPACGLHSSFIALKGGKLTPLTVRDRAPKRTTAEQNRNYVGSRWQRDLKAEKSCCCCNEESDMDKFIRMTKLHSFTVTAMAFQDAMNLDIERLRSCSLHVYENGTLKPFCAKYLTEFKER